MIEHKRIATKLNVSSQQVAAVAAHLKMGTTGFLVSDSPGIGFIEAIEQAGENQKVYQRLGNDVSRKIDFEDRLLSALKKLAARRTCELEVIAKYNKEAE